VIIADTNVVSELMLPVPSERVRAWVTEQRKEDEVFLTAVNVAEIVYGIELLPKGKRRDDILLAAEAMLATEFVDRILSFDEPAARAFGKIAAARRLMGRPISEFDAQIASITRANDATLATRNIADFEDCGIRLVNPWVD
jgi:hypothetical protein